MTLRYASSLDKRGARVFVTGPQSRSWSSSSSRAAAVRRSIPSARPMARFDAPLRRKRAAS